MQTHSHVSIAALVLAAGMSAGCGDGSTPTSSVTARTRGAAPAHTLSSGQITVTLGRSTVAPFHVQSEYLGHKVEIKSQDASDINVNSSSLDVGGSTGWHSHSGPVMVVVTSGAFTMYHGDDPDCSRQVYPAGTAFIEEGGLKDIHIGRNEGAVPVTWIATAILPVGVPGRVDEPSQGNCPF